MANLLWLALSLVTLGHTLGSASPLNATASPIAEKTTTSGVTDQAYSFSQQSSFSTSGSEPHFSSSDTYNVYHAAASNDATSSGKNSAGKPSKNCKTVEKPMPNFGNYDDGVKRVMTCYVCGDSSGYGGFTENCNFSPSKEEYSQTTSTHFIQRPYSSDYKASPSSYSESDGDYQKSSPSSDRGYDSYDGNYAPQATRDHNSYDKDEEGRYDGMTCKTVYKGQMKCKVCNNGNYGNAYSEDCGYDSYEPGQHHQNTYDYSNANQKSYRSPYNDIGGSHHSGRHGTPNYGSYGSGTSNVHDRPESYAHGDDGSYSSGPYNSDGYFSQSKNYGNYKNDDGKSYKGDDSGNYDDGSYKGDDSGYYGGGDSSNYRGSNDGSYKGDGASGYKSDDGGSYKSDGASGYKSDDGGSYKSDDGGSYKGDDGGSYKGDDGGSYKGDGASSYKGDDGGNYKDASRYEDGGYNGEDKYKSRGDYNSAGSGNKNVAVTSPRSGEKSKEKKCETVYKPMSSFGAQSKGEAKMKCLVCVRGDGFGGVTEECNYSSGGTSGASFPNPMDLSSFFGPHFQDNNYFSGSNDDPYRSFPF